MATTKHGKELEERVKERDGHKCRECGRGESSAKWQCLVTHHIVPRALGGKDEEGNMITLCPTCHRKAHKGEHSPYAISKRNTENGGLSTRLISRILMVNGTQVNRWRSEGVLPAHATLDDVSSLINGIEQRCKERPRNNGHQLKHIVIMRERLEDLRDYGDVNRRLFTQMRRGR